MRELGIYLDLIACNFVLLIKLLPYRSRASLTAAFAEASRLTVAFGAGLVGCSMLRELLTRRTLIRQCSASCAFVIKNSRRSV